MRTLVAFVLLAAAAVAAALLFRIGDGYVMLVSPPYRVELSQNAFLILAVLLFVALYAVVRALVRLARLPADVRAVQARRRDERLRGRIDSAMVALIEGRHGKARQYAEEALAIPGSPPIPALIGARAALETRDFDAARAMLDRPDAQGTRLAVPRLMLEAELALERGQPAEALARLADLRDEAGLHTAAQRLELRALTAAGRSAEIPPLVDRLVKRKVYDPAQGAALRAAAHADALASLVHDPAGLRTHWARVGEADRVLPVVAQSAARAFLAVNADRDAVEAIVRALDRNWDTGLLLLYGECRAPDATRQLDTAERWLTRHSGDATLLYVLGRLCERQELWGKAQTYFEASLALDNHWRAQVALGEMLAKLGRHDEANPHLAAALQLALAELEGQRVSVSAA